MRHLPEIQVMQRALRAGICTQCSQRPHGSEALAAETPRACEPGCGIFVHLEKLNQVAAQHDAATGSYEAAMRAHVCGGCKLTETAGEFCSEYFARTCPLSRYSGQVIEILERVQRDHAPGHAA